RFYRDVLGLRLIKQTVNFDDSGVYHLYFGDYHGNPGTIITFFPWTNDNYGRKGSGQVGKIAFRVPKNSLDHWQEHLTNQNIEVHKTKLFGKDTLEFEDIHGLELAIVEGDTTADCPDILSFHGATLWSGDPEATETLLTDLMGLEKLNHDDDYLHYQTVGEEKFQVTDVRDRNYFKSIYTSEAGNIVFEFATDGPGFDVDEDVASLGTALKLPEQYEHRRQ